MIWCAVPVTSTTLRAVFSIIGMPLMVIAMDVMCTDSTLPGPVSERPGFIACRAGAYGLDRLYWRSSETI